MSDAYYGLSKMEYILLIDFWNNNGPVSFSDVEKYCNTELHYNWAQPTLHTYLTRLTKKEFFIRKERAINVNVPIIPNLRNRN